MAGTAKNNKKTASSKKTASGAKRQTQTKKSGGESSFIRSEVVMIASFAIAVLLFLSNFQLCGVAGDFLRKVQLGIFGMVGFVAPVLLFVGTCFYLSNKGNPIAAVKMVSVIVSILTLCALAQMLFGGGYVEGQKLTDCFKNSSINGSGGGFLGGLFVLLLGSVLGTVGTYLVLAVVLIICAVCITEKSVVSAVKKGSGTAYRYAKEDVDRRKILHEERKEERRRLREEQKVRGVDLNSTKLDGEPGGQPGTPAGLEPQSAARAVDVEPGLGLDDAFREAGFDLKDDWAEKTGAALRGTAGDVQVAEADSEAEPKVRKADIFTGKIAIPRPYIDEDSVPFDPDEVYHDAAAAVSMEPPFDPSVPVQGGGSSLGMGLWEDGHEIFPKKDTRTLSELDIVEDEYYPSEKAEGGVNYSEFFIPEEPKKVVTASGKIIETDTEMLKKKLEAKRGEAAQNQETAAGVAEEIKKKPVIKKEYKFPPVTLLKRGSRIAGSYSEKEYKETAIKLQQTLQNFGVGVTVTNVSCGPSVTRYELHPEQGVKVSKIVGLADDIKLSLAAPDIRIEAPIPGKSAVGIEVPNKENNVVLLRDLLEAEEFKTSASKLSFAVGKDIGGQIVVTDVAKMPHLLIAGATGSGKSVCINTLIVSLIYKAAPDDVKMIMIDPKVVELSVYNGIPHLLIPVVTDPKKAAGALNWAVAEMMERYKKFADYNVRDLKGYNAKIETIKDIEDENKPQKLPQIVIIVDELADLMMVAPGEVEDAICRLAQLARAAGIHLVIATQRPSVNVITGLIKANVPSRIAFSVSSGVDSRTIIDMNGAEKLLGKGDMLFYPAGYQKPQRVQGAFVSDQEVAKVVDFLTAQDMVTEYNPDIESQMSAPAAPEVQETLNSRDEYFTQAGRFIIEKDKASIGMLQRMYKIGFNRAARIMDQLAEAGVVGEEEGTKPRKVLMSMEEFEAMIEQGL